MNFVLNCPLSLRRINKPFFLSRDLLGKDDEELEHMMPASYNSQALKFQLTYYAVVTVLHDGFFDSIQRSHQIPFTVFHQFKQPARRPTVRRNSHGDMPRYDPHGGQRDLLRISDPDLRPVEGQPIDDVLIGLPVLEFESGGKPEEESKGPAGRRQ